MISLNKNICNDLEEAISREWLETNRLGGFASGTVAGANTAFSIGTCRNASQYSRQTARNHLCGNLAFVSYYHSGQLRGREL